MTKHDLRDLMMPFALLAAGVAMTSFSLKAGDAADSEQVSKLLSQAKTSANQIREDASTMESYSRWRTDWRNHTDTVNEMREHINVVGNLVTKLDAARAGASPWQMTAIDRIKPLLREIASNTERLITALNKDPRRLNMAEYKDYIEANSDEAAQLSELIADFVNYGNSKSRMDHLANKLEIPTT